MIGGDLHEVGNIDSIGDCQAACEAHTEAAKSGGGTALNAASEVRARSAHPVHELDHRPRACIKTLPQVQV